MFLEVVIVVTVVALWSVIGLQLWRVYISSGWIAKVGVELLFALVSGPILWWMIFLAVKRDMQQQRFERDLAEKAADYAKEEEEESRKVVM